MTPVPLLTPAQLASMSWYHRQRYEARRRAWVRHQRAKYVPLDGDAHDAMQQTIRLLDDALNGVANGNPPDEDRKSTRLNSSHVKISYAVFCLKKKTTETWRRHS